MIRAAASVVIERPIDEVFAFMADFENDRRWRSDVVEIARVSGDVAGPGARYHQVVRPGSRPVELDFETSDVDPGRRLRFRSTSGPAHVEGAYTFEPAGAGTRVAFLSEIRPRGILRLAEQSLGRAIQGGSEVDLRRLKAVLESRGVRRRGGA